VKAAFIKRRIETGAIAAEERRAGPAQDSPEPTTVTRPSPNWPCKVAMNAS